MQTILTVFHIFLAVGLVGLILIQHGKGADMGAAFGSGASGTVFGAKGSASFLTRATALLATLFFVTSMVMAYFASQRNEQVGVMEALDQQAPAVQVEEVQQSDIPPIPVESDMPAIAPAAEPAEAPVEPAMAEPVEMGAETGDSANAEATQDQAKE
ncbi:MAG: preprotein translocase subunit SecG [gamma proteobacterium symbiont of Ctena orbiculata]|nr:preprotein translocase subunit SecG [Candidatus Thiodiazotropha taylori]MBT3057550.1 preprotein translocase subunit SecG [Candidatus Thiodiazotropha sp. (ex Lucina pensylvanica)]MBV2095947.1 preprotein translocase subunit SecG [Candidatus Thiodiazotropha sp. (ex Codakia orbicularis)]PUB76323.1 MAG: preprotein translocase subunit SecG [gamma proteobacterium symbiont of Ctena orbiculata]MBT3062672.1 preprotein translocase subunit SecG [Candidatus Thiodiazotropha sp. (ex Lucina pensylvanica)]